MRTQEELDILYAKFDMDTVKRSRVFRFLLILDQMMNVLLWDGSQDETVSSHIHRRQTKGTATWFDNKLCWLLNKIENSHCMASRGE